MNETVSQIMGIVTPALITTLGILVSWGLNELRKFVKSKTDSGAIDIAFKQFNKIANGAVVRAEQSMKIYGADGKITKEEAKQIKENVFRDVKSQLPASTEVLLKKVVNNLDSLIDTKIETEVYNMKQNKNRV
jgi:nucleoid-associated protein YejK